MLILGLSCFISHSENDSLDIKKEIQGFGWREYLWELRGNESLSF